MRLRISLIIFLFLLTGVVSGAPEQPHRVFGEVTDASDKGLEVEGEFTYQGDTLKDFQTDERGNYDVKIPGGEYDGESLSIIIEGQKEGSIDFEPLGVTEKDIIYTNEVDQKEDPSQGGSGGGAGGLGNFTGESKENEKDETVKAGNSSEENADSERKESITDTDNQEPQEKITADEPEKIVRKARDTDDDGKVQVTLGNDDSGNEDRSIDSIEFSSPASNESVEVNVTEMSESEFKDNLGNEIKAPSGEVYKFTQIDTDKEVENATIEFKVQKSFIQFHEASKEEVVNMRYSQGTWQKLETDYKYEENQSYFYESRSPEGFSNFAIAIDTADKVRSDDSARSLILKVILGILALLLIVLGYTILKRRRSGREMIGLENY
jgi:PGF-pre-PGF domain-containing protein